MMHASLTAASLFDDVLEAMGLFSPPPRSFFRDVLNECLTRLYTELVCESHTQTLSVNGQYLPYESLHSPTGTPVRREDILAVYADERQARHLRADLHGLASDAEKENFFATDEGGVCLALPAATLRVRFLLRPPLCTEENEASYAIPLYAEFMPLLRARLLGEGYKEAGEDALAAKWLAEYNHALDGFAAYLATRKVKEG